MAQVLNGRPAGPALQPHELPRLPDREAGISGEPHRFLLWYHPDSRWAVRKVGDGYRWLPELSRQLLKPGVNGVRAAGKAVSYTEAAARKVNAGWVLIAPALGPDGDYVREYDTAAGKRYADAWTTFSRAGTGYRGRFDDDGYAAWLAGLVDAGEVSPPSDWAREAWVTEATREIDAMRQRGRVDSDWYRELSARLEYGRTHDGSPSTPAPSKARR